MMNKIKNYFYYSRLERNGIFVLSFLCIVFFLFPQFYQSSSVKSPIDFSPFEEEIRAFEKSSKEKQKSVVFKVAAFDFDPNTVTEEGLKKLGLSPKVIKTFLNFRSKGGKFFKKEDFKKVYGITDEDYARLADFIQIDLPKKKIKEESAYKKEPKFTKIRELFEFDPNLISRDDLAKLGFSKKAANNLIKFRERGGVIRKKEELSKIYGVSENLFEKLLPYVTIGEEHQPKPFTEKSRPKTIEAKSDFKLEINSASKEDWQKLYGIGPFYAERIIESREKLGGFYNINQVGETYNLPDSTFRKIRPQLELNTPPKQLNLNAISVKELARHPYIKYKQAKAILNYRDQHGPFKNLNELEKIIALKPAIISKIKPYLKLE